MLLIAAFWGCWQLLSGLILALYWSRNPPANVQIDALGEGTH